ncbi:MAG: glucose-6-phosphate dehydrogenase, partial [Syntrophobacteraceae bacterium]
MQGDKINNATVFVIFGGGGDLTWRKLAPALYSLFLDGYMPERFAILGVGRKQVTDDSYRQHLREGVDKFSIGGKTDEKSWAEFAGHIAFLKADPNDPQSFGGIAKELSAYDETWGAKAARIYYMA